MTVQNELYRVVHVQDSQSTTGVEQHRVGGSKVGLNGCPFQRLREGYRKDTKRARGMPDRNVDPSSRPITTVIGPLHECKKVWSCTKALPRSGSRAWIKQGRKKRKKRGRETGKTEARRLMERKAAQQNKTHRRN